MSGVVRKCQWPSFVDLGHDAISHWTFTSTSIAQHGLCTLAFWVQRLLWSPHPPSKKTHFSKKEWICWRVLGEFLGPTEFEGGFWSEWEMMDDVCLYWYFFLRIMRELKEPRISRNLSVDFVNLQRSWCSQETESAKDAYTAAEDGEGSDEAGVPVWSKTWQWKAWHLKMYFPIENGDVPIIMLVFRGFWVNLWQFDVQSFYTITFRKPKEESRSPWKIMKMTRTMSFQNWVFCCGFVIVPFCGQYEIIDTSLPKAQLNNAINNNVEEIPEPQSHPIVVMNRQFVSSIFHDIRRIF